MWGELNFEYSDSSATDILIEVSDYYTNEDYGVKKFYSTDSAQINIAPMIFDYLLPEPMRYTTLSAGFPSKGFPRIKVSVGDVQCEVRYFTYAKSEMEAPALLTSLPKNRLLYAGECDQLSVLCPVGTYLAYELVGTAREAGGVELNLSGSAIYTGGAGNIYINADLYCQDYSSLTLSIYAGTELIDQVAYTLECEQSNGYRVAWISSYGSIEYYTFPFVDDLTQLSSGAVTKTLRSAYGTAGEVEALSEIITSPKVWHATSDDFTLIEVLSDELVLRQAGELMITTIKIQENG